MMHYNNGSVAPLLPDLSLYCLLVSPNSILLFGLVENSIVDCNRTVRAVVPVDEGECVSLFLSPLRVSVQGPHGSSQSSFLKER